MDNLIKLKSCGTELFLSSDSVKDAIGEPLTYGGERLKINMEGDNVAYARVVCDANFNSITASSNVWNGGMSAVKDRLILSFNMGWVVLLDLNNMQTIASGKLASYASSNHANNISWGFKQDGEEYPLIYVSECNESARSYRCFVEQIHVDGSTITSTNVQTILYNGSMLMSNKTVDWAVDRVAGYIYAYGYTHINVDDVGIRIMKFKLPSISESNVTLSDSDILAEGDVKLRSVLQGSAVCDGVIALPYSNERYSGIAFYDFNRLKAMEHLDIRSIQEGKEVEGITMYNDKIYVCFHSAYADAKIWEISI